jgi:hypothetical protein
LLKFKLGCYTSGDVDARNIVRPTVDQLLAEDHQAYEAFIKDREEENTWHKEKEIEEKCQWFLSHFSRNRKGEVSKGKEEVILSDEEEQAKANNNVSTSTSPITMEQISQLLVDGQEKVLATVQNMIDKSLGKQPLANDSSAPMSSVASSFQNHTMPPESSAIPAPQYDIMMVRNLQSSTMRVERSDRFHKTVRPVLVDRFQLVRPVS